MREEKLERYLEVEGIEPSTEGYSKLVIKTNNLYLCRELNPEPHAPKSGIVRFELSSLDFSGQRKFASCLVAFYDLSSEDFK